jgi:hypothetical protein
MKRILLTALSGFLFAALSFAQIPSGTAAQPQPATPPTQQIPEPSAQPQQQPAGQPLGTQPHNTKIAPGSVIPVQLTKTIDAKKAKSGDEVVAKVTMDMKTSTGELIVPKDTKVVGHVTAAQARNKEQKESQMGIAFDRAVMKDGSEVSLPMSIQAIVAPQQNNPPSDAENTGNSAPAAGGSTAASPMGNRAPLAPPSQPQPAPASGSDPQASNSARPTINASTQGVIGIRDLKLEASAQNATQGSVMSSEKNNVKLESGTMLLLKVNQ